jgi:hypothetical protein
MQKIQQRESLERISWARALIFAAGFFLISAILLGQLPSVVYAEMTEATLQQFEQLCLSLGFVCLGGFAVVQVIVLLFDPKPLIPPKILTVLGVILVAAGLALCIWATTTGCVPNSDLTMVTCNQYFPAKTMYWHAMLGGNVLWFQPGAVDFVMIGLTVLGVGLAMIFYSILALREMRNPDRRDLGTTPAIRWMIIGSILLLILFLFAYNKTSDLTLGLSLFPSSPGHPGHPFVGYKLVQLLVSIILGAAIFMALGAFALRLHYLMRPIRKRTMSVLYIIGALGLAQTGAIFIVLWAVAYPLLALIHPWTFIGLGSYLTNCARPSVVPGSCSFTQDAASIVDTIITSSFFGLLMAAIWAWKSHRNLVVIGSVVTTAVIGATALLVHTAPSQLLSAMLLCVAILVLAAIWTTTSRGEFAIVGQNNLGCLGQWLVVGTCLLVYLAAFAFFSMPYFSADETPPNIPFTPGSSSDAFIMLIILGSLAGVQFFFLVRNRYRV